MLLAHSDLVERDELSAAWTLDPAVLAPLALASVLYTVAVGRLWVRTSPGRGVRPRHAVAFSLALGMIVLALVSPVDRLATTLLSAHMAQHLLLMSLVAPLIAYGLPLALFPGALSTGVRRGAHRWRRVIAGRLGTHALALTVTALLLHTVALWLWHVPSLHEAAVTDHRLHALQHASFLGTGIVFWWAILGTGRRTAPSGIRIAALFAATLQGAALGALMTFSESAWYPVYEAGGRLWGIEPLADQQLAGLLMWGFGAIVPVVAAAFMMVAWLERGVSPSAPPRRQARFRPRAD